MKYSMLERGANGSKDIGAFYGVNRTNKINDYQMSDMMNFDCESFPYLATRRERKLFYDENKMATICHDTDITDDYAVTGVTKDGGFVYRGEKLIDSGLSTRSSVTEFLGDYVLLPEKKYIRIKKSMTSKGKVVQSASQGNFRFSEKKYIRDAWESDYTASSFTPTVGDYINVSANKIYTSYDNGDSKIRGYLSSFVDFFFDMYPGMYFHLNLYSYGESVKYSCNIPNDIHMVVDDLYFVQDDITYKYGDENFTRSQVNEEECTLYISFSARREATAELYNISQHFKMFPTNGTELVAVDEYKTGLAKIDLSNYRKWYNCIEIITDIPVMLFGEYFGGRLFACDNMGVDIYYSPGGSVKDRYNFDMGESLGGAGAVSCAEAGKWTALKSYGGALYAFKKDGMYRIYSNDGLSFYMDKVCDVGAVSEKAVCVVSDVMYFLSETGLYRFTGTYPEELTDNLGRRYTDGVLGGYDNKVYCSLVYSGGCELVVYDATVRAFGVHDGFNAENFVTYGGKLYGLDSADGYVYEMSGERVPTEFSLITRKFFLSFEKKAINGIRLYFDFSGGENEKMEVFVSYDGGEWEPCFKPIVSGRLKYVPIKFKKCDELAVKIAGYGVFTLKGMTLSLYSGGDIKQNR